MQITNSTFIYEFTISCNKFKKLKPFFCNNICVMENLVIMVQAVFNKNENNIAKFFKHLVDFCKFSAFLICSFLTRGQINMLHQHGKKFIVFGLAITVSQKVIIIIIELPLVK